MTPRTRRRDERGAVVPIVAVCLPIIIVATAFAVDLGLQRVLRRDLQALADVVALDLARELDGRPRAEYDAAELDAALAASMARNDDVVGDDPDLDYELGTTGTSGFHAAAPDDVPTAVKVEASGHIGFAFAGTGGSAGRAAVASAEKSACFNVGSFAASLRSEDSWLLKPLLRILGSSIDVGVLTGELASVDLPLIDILGDPLIGLDLDVLSFEEVADATVTLHRLYLAMASVLERRSGSTAAVALLNRLAELEISRIAIRLGDLVGLDTATEAALDVGLNVLDLVTGSLFIANGENILDLNLAVPVNVGNVVNINLPASVKIGQKPVAFCGLVNRVRGESSQVVIEVGDTSRDEVHLGLPGLVAIDGDLDLTVKLDPVYATLADVSCRSGEERLDFLVAHGLLDVALDLNLDVSLFKSDLWDGIKVANVPVTATVDPRDATVRGSLSWANGDFSKPLVVGSGDGISLQDIRLDTSRLAVLGIPVGKLTSVLLDQLLLPLVNGVVRTLNTLLLTPLLNTLGLNVAGGEIRGLPTPECGTPVLRG